MFKTRTVVKLLIYCILLICMSGKISATNLEKFDSIMQIALKYKNHSPDSLAYFVNEAYLIAQSENDPERKLEALTVLIDAKIRSGELLDALELCDSIDEISKNDNLIHREVDILLKIGNVYQSMGLDAQSLELFFEALNSSKTDISIRNKVDIFYYIAIVYFNLAEIEECRKYLDLSLNLALKHNFTKDALPIYMLYASTFNQPDSVTKYIHLANQLLDNYPKLIYEKVVIVSKQALLNKALGNYNESKSQYLNAINISENNGFQKHLSTLYNNYAYLLMAETKYDSAKYYLGQALDISITVEDIDLESEIYDSYSDYYEKIGDYENALAYSDLFIEKRDQYREQQQIQKSLFLSAVFKTEQKEKEILQQKNEINQLWVLMLSIVAILAIFIGLGVYLRQKLSLSKSRLEAVKKGKALEIADALIKGQDAERKRLAMDLHDGLGARLSSLQFLVDGFFTTNEKYDDVTTSITNIHENIRDLSHRMLPAQLEDIGLISTISNLASSISKSNKFNIEFETNLEKRLTDKLEINLYYLIYELINNATKHSNGNNITVQLFEHDGILHLSVEDDGSGFKPDKNSSGFGLKNIRTRVEYLGGELVIESTDIQTIFLIEIPNTRL